MMKAMMNVKRTISMILTMVMIAAMAAYAPANANAAEEFDYEAAAAEIVEIINNARIENGLEALEVLPYLNEVAETRAIETAINFDHRRRNGEGFETAIDMNKVEYTFAAELIGAATATAAETFANWEANENNMANILAENATHIGAYALYDEDTDYGYYWQITIIEAETEAEAEIVEGDLTGDGMVNAYDYIALTNYIAKTNAGIEVNLTAAQIEAADCFNDGIITEADAKVMVRFLLGECTALPYNF